MTQLNQLLQTALQENNYNFPQDLQNKFIKYLELLDQWNNVFNLTAIRDAKDAVYLHILDSLSILPYLHGEQIIDVGSGAGLPGIPLALVSPNKKFVLLDSNSKKTRFLNQVVYELGIKNVTVVHARCESFHPAQGFDSIITRAFASLKEMLSITQHMLGKQGQFIAMKGIYPETEISEIPNEFKLLAVHQLKIHGLDAARHVVSILRRE